MPATSPRALNGPRPGAWWALLLAAIPVGVGVGGAGPAVAWEVRLGGDARYYQFGLLDADVQGRRDLELGLFRLGLTARSGAEVVLEAQGVLDVASPAAASTTALVTGTTPRLLDLEHVFVDESDLRVAAELDRLSVTWQRPAFRLVVGRQAITWGVSYFWPALDLFGPFPPERADREYKPGVDAVRLTLPFGSLSELDLVAAGQGTSLEEDGSIGGLHRLHLGAVDVGAMAGWFHRDVVAGAFVVADVRGTGVRAEVAFTDSGEPADARLGRARFWRAGIGLDRQLTAAIAASLEAAWNGFGASEPDRYRATAEADRVRRGEVPSLGQWYLGASATWQAHPLVTVTASALANLGDGSVLLLPRVDWSLTDDLALVLGAVVGLGPGPRPDGELRSEYGAAIDSVYAAIKAYF
jgi:hypothetical protein